MFSRFSQTRKLAIYYSTPSFPLTFLPPLKVEWRQGNESLLPVSQGRDWPETSCIVVSRPHLYGAGCNYRAL
ncbi:unnamed protein product [Leptosia nina]|uniref:Uncharacterized protein n=1 Tax=Leptosia nina TaxID=320188 RepID=A0AAV1J8F3_9NEOP